ncbi:MAG: methionyl-tRNA formyltransferase [Parcubacteria group bacterium]
MAKNNNEIKIVFMGTPIFAVTILKALQEATFNIVGVFTRPDKKVGRNQELQKSDVKVIAENYNLPVIEMEKINDEFMAKIASLKPDIIVVAAFGSILPKSVLDIPKFGSVNVHASILPKYRGPSPIQNAILRGEKETGVTIMLMDEGIDTGDILTQEKIEIGENENLIELYERLANLGAKLLVETIPRFVNGEIKPVVQDNAHAVICELIEKSDGKINWSESADTLYNCYRAFTPWPGIFTFLEKNGTLMRIKLNKISKKPGEKEKKHHLGEVFAEGDEIFVQAGDGCIVLEEIQPEGKTNMDIKSFINGNPEFIGSILK